MSLEWKKKTTDRFTGDKKAKKHLETAYRVWLTRRPRLLTCR